MFSQASNSFYRRKGVFKRESEAPVAYAAMGWVDIYTSPANSEYDSEIVEFSIEISGTPTNPKHRILVIPKNFQGNQSLPTVAYPYDTGLVSQVGQETISGDSVGPFPTIPIPQGAQIKVQVWSDVANAATAELLYIELLEQR